MADKNSENRGSLEEREKATKELFERDIAKDGSRKDLEADDVLGSDHHEVAQADVAMAEKADDKLHREAEDAADTASVKLDPSVGAEQDSNENGNQSLARESRVPKSAPTANSDDVAATPSVFAGDSRSQQVHGLHNQPQQETVPSVDPSTESAPDTFSLGIEQPEPDYGVDKLDSTVQESLPGEPLEASSIDGGDQELVVANLVVANPHTEQSYNYELIGSGRDYFELVNNQILIKPGVNIDTTQSSSHSLTFQITDESGNTHQETVVINVDLDAEEAVIVLGVPEEQADPISEDGSSPSHEEQEPEESLTFSLLDETEAPAGFVLHEDGSYDLDVTHEAYQHLGVGDSQTLVVPVQIITDQGEVTTTEIQVVIHGSNDLPIVAAEQSAEATEGSSTVEGEIFATDVDDNSVLSFAVSDGNHLPDGFVLSLDGHYSFSAENYNGLGEGERQILEIPITVTDEHGATAHTTLSITITGTNDGPVAVAQGSSIEEGELLTGQLQASDVDLAEGVVLSFATASEVDGLTLNEDGSYSFDASVYQSLGEGETQTIEVAVMVTDDQGAVAETTLTITVTGTNDKPVAEAHEVSVDESGLVTGQLQASDVDLAEGAALSFTVLSEFDGLTLNEDGSYSFDASSYQSLGAGETEIIEVPVTVTDDQGATAETTLTITVTGTNDNPVAEAHQISAEEGGLLTGQIQASDVDLAEGSSLSFTTVSEVEGLTLNEDGSYSFDAYSYQSLGEGETQFIEVPVTVTDDQGATAETTLTITVTGTNDNPVAEAHQISAEEGGLLTGQIQASDVDLAEGSSLSFTTVSEVEGLTLNEDGSYSFDAYSYQSLGEGETQFIEVPVTVTDDQGATTETTLTITVTGTNDNPVAEAHQISAEEGGLLSGRLQASDVDLADGTTLSFTTSSEVDGLTLNEDGSYSFDASSYQSLGAGEREFLEVPVLVTDDRGATAETTLTIIVTGTNDAPVAEAQQTSVDEGELVKGQLKAGDVDLAEGSTLSFSTTSEIEGLTLNEDGTYSFDTSAYQSLGEGESQTVEVPVTVTDDQGGTAETTLTITVIGTNDNPIAEAHEVSVDESGLVTGQLQASDVDLADGATLSFTTSSEVEGLTLNEDGSYSFDASTYQSLGEGETEFLEVPVVVTDDQGATAETTLTITVTGTNDAPVAEAQQASVEEGVSVKGQLKAGDVDLAEGSLLSFSSTSEVEGLTLNEDGSYSFEASSYRSLGEGETEIIEVPVTVTDDQGATAETTLTITVMGTNDAPVAEIEQVAVDEGNFVSGQLEAGDIDLAEGSALSFSNSSEVDGLTLNEDGSYSFDASSYQSLGEGETEIIEVPVTVTDDQGATAETTLTITVMGTNDAPVAEAQQVSVEEGVLVKGQLKAGDVDLAEGSLLSFSSTSEVEGLTLNEDGSYSFEASSYRSLGEGETEIIEVPVTVTDDQGATAETTLTITVTGTNDAPVAEAEQAAVDEGNFVNGQLEAGDIDLAEGSALSFSTTSEIEGLTLNEDGSYSFDASSYQSLGEGETESIEVPVTVTDDQGAIAETTLTITVMGTNDAPVAEAEQVAVDEGNFVSGQLEAGDVDLAEGSALSFSSSSEVDGLTLNEDGSYSFDASSYQSLGEGETETIEVPVTVTDEQGASAETTLTITVTGTNDAPVTEAEQVTVDEGALVKGQLEGDDVDLAEGSTLSFSTASEIEGLSLNEDGSYTFDASSYQSLGEGETAIFEVPVVVADDQGATAETTLTISVTGTNDAPVAEAEQVAVDEGNFISGQLEAGDVDLADGSSLSFSTSSEVEGLTLNEDGSYSFDASSYQSLGEGEAQSIEVPVAVTDDQGATAETTLTITVTGTNDAPVADAQQTTVEEGAFVKGQLNAGDVDLAEGSSLSFSTASEIEGLTLIEDGSYAFDASSYQSLGEGETATFEVPVVVTDDQGATAETTLTITVTGTNDVPVAEAQQTSVEEGELVKGQLKAGDIDLAEGSALSFSTSSEVEGLIINDDGSYTFDASSYQSLGAGETETLDIPVVVSDDQGSTAETTLTITVTGTNDAPVAEAEQVAVDEGNFISGQLEAGDVDLAEGSALSFSTTSEIEGLTLNEDGSYSFDASSYQSMGEGETESIEVPVTVTDDQGATAETTLTITVMGTNDNPVAEAQEISAEEGGLLTGQLQASDIDLAQSADLSFSTSSEVEGLTLYQDGSYSFDASSYQSLGEGETATFEVPVVVTDDQGAAAETTLTITVTGTNDAPGVDAQQTAVEEGAFVKGQLKADDVDLAEGSSLSFSTSSEVEGLTLHEDGSYSFDATSYQSLGEGETESIEVPVTVTDDQGATAETTLTITVTGTNDVPIAEAQELTVDEGGLLTGQLQAGDVDLAEGASLSFTTVSEVEGLTLNEDGSYSFDASSFQSLGAGEVQTIEVPITVTDDQGVPDETTLTITVTGTNDAPVAEAEQVTVDEGAFIKGQLEAGDADLAEGSTLSFSTVSEIEGLTLNEDGSYSFDTSSYQSLGEGETANFEVPVVVTDDQGAAAETTLMITVTGTNDAPVAEAQETSVEEGAFVKGQLKADDVDLAEGSTLSFSTSSEVEGLTLNEDGSYSFDASSYQSLSAGEAETIDVPVSVTDDQGATAETTLTITVTGTNDAPVAEAEQVALDEGAFVKGQLEAGDVDLAEGSSLSFSTSSEVEGLTLYQDGSYSFDASSYHSLGEGETATFEVPVVVTDDQGAAAETTLTITVTGTNDAPVAKAQQTAVEEGAFVKGQLKAGDVDLAEGSTLSFSTSSEVEGLTLYEDGSYSFDASSYQSLSAGETQSIEVPVSVSDDQGATAETTLTITVTGTNDAPVAEAQQTAVEEGAFVKGQLKAGDVDLAEDSSLSFSTSSEVEGLTLYEDGSFSFDASSYQSLGAGETETLEVPVVVTDDHGGTAETTLTVTVTGTNDLPSVVAEEIVVEEGEIIRGQLEATDIDLPIGSSLSFSTNADIEGLTLNADGSYSFDASGYEGLDRGESATIEVPVVVEDDQGGKAETILTINVEGIDSDTDSSGGHEVSDPDKDDENQGRGEEGGQEHQGRGDRDDGEEDQGRSDRDDREEHRGRGDRDDREEHRGRGDREDREEHRGRGGRDDREEHRGRGDREDREEHQGRGDRDDREEHRGRGDRDDREEHRGRGGRDEREEHRSRGGRDDREEHRGRGDREDREEHQGRGDRDDREEHRGRGGRDDREEHRGRGDREDREEHQGRGDRDDREEHRGRGGRDDREEHRGRGDRDDREEHRGRGGRDEREEHRGRGGRDDREEHRGRGDREDREEHRGRGGRDEREEHRGRGDRDDREEHRGRGGRDDREEHRGRGDRDDREEHRGRGGRDDREEHRGRGGRDDREEHRGRGGRDDREEHRGRGGRDDREEHRGLGGRDDREEHRGRGGRDDREEHRGRGGRDDREEHRGRGGRDDREEHRGRGEHDDREHHRGWGHRDDWDEHPRNSEHGERHPQRGHRFREENEESHSSPTDIQVQGG
ncbi:MAG: VCBS domain-containing protein, partial [Candidatus Thiodiazotropha taylori]|nr:VCBS domain-containing protein [Candidatus Thiodiazotropha taylori]